MPARRCRPMHGPRGNACSTDAGHGSPLCGCWDVVAGRVGWRGDDASVPARSATGLRFGVSGRRREALSRVALAYVIFGVFFIGVSEVVLGSGAAEELRLA